MGAALKDLAVIQTQIHEESKKKLEELIEPIKKEGVNVSVTILWGTPWLEIIREVLRNHHDLVMVTPRKKTKLKKCCLEAEPCI